MTNIEKICKELIEIIKDRDEKPIPILTIKLAQALMLAMHALDCYQGKRLYEYPEDWKYSKEGGPPEFSDCTVVEDIASEAISDIEKIFEEGE